jgi:hypothetical protein
MDPDDLDLVGAGEVSVRRVLSLRCAELVLRRERDPCEVLDPLDVLWADPGLFELAAVEG